MVNVGNFSMDRTHTFFVLVFLIVQCVLYVDCMPSVVTLLEARGPLAWDNVDDGLGSAHPDVTRLLAYAG